MANQHYTEEVWRVIWEAPSHMVSNFGRVMRIRAHRAGRIGKILKPWTSKDGYLMITLYEHEEGRARAFQLHRLICKAFVGPQPSPRHQVAHGNGVRSDNRPENLRWATSKENNEDRVHHKTDPTGIRNPMAKLTEADVHAIRREPRVYGAPGKLARRYGVSDTTISGIMEGATWQNLPWEDGVRPQARMI